MEGPVSSCELILASCGTCTTSEFRKMLSRTRLRRDNHPSNPSVVTTVPTGIFSHSVWVLTFGSGIMRGPLCLLGRSGRRWRAEGEEPRVSGCPLPSRHTRPRRPRGHHSRGPVLSPPAVWAGGLGPAVLVGGSVAQVRMGGLGRVLRDVPVRRETSCV